MVYGLIEMCGCKPFGTLATEKLALGIVLAEGADVDPLVRGAVSLGICMVQFQRTAFDSALEWAERAREEFGQGSPYLAHVDLHTGSVAMVRGRADEAKRCYDRALQAARASHLRDAGTMMLGQVLSAELALERSTGAPGAEGTDLSPQVLGECGAWLDIYAASTEVRAELALLRGDAQAARAAIEQALEHARRTERTQLSRFLSALRVSVLAAGGEVGEAVRAWRIERLPEDAAGCIDLASQSWREAEMLACTRLRLLTAQGAFDCRRGNSLGRFWRWPGSGSWCGQRCGAWRWRSRLSGGAGTTTVRGRISRPISGCSPRPATRTRSCASGRPSCRSSTRWRARAKWMKGRRGWRPCWARPCASPPMPGRTPSERRLPGVHSAFRRVAHGIGTGIPATP